MKSRLCGTGKKHRPAFYEMLAAVRSGEVDAIVARHQDRLARNPRERLELVEACRDHGAIIALVQGTDMDLTTASGRVVIGVLGEIAEMEIGIKSERHAAALERHARAGKVPHGPRLFGYTAQSGVEPKESVIVRDVFERFYAGESLRSLVRRPGPRAHRPENRGHRLEAVESAPRLWIDELEEGRTGIRFGSWRLQTWTRSLRDSLRKSPGPRPQRRATSTHC